MHYLTTYPAAPAARDRFIVDLRAPRPRHDPWRPHDLAVEDEITERGDRARVGTVFLTGRECPWRCAMCDLWRFTTREDTPAGAIPAQIASARQLWRERLEPVSRVKLYNASNFFDPRAVPETDYEAIASHLRGLELVVVESHPALVGDRVTRLQEALRPTALEVAMGLETTHTAALDALNKRMTTADFAGAAAWLRARAISLRAFVLIQPPFVPADEQDEWLLKTIAFAEECGASVISLIPTRGGNGTMEALAREGLFRAPTSDDVARSYALACARTSSGGVPGARVLLDPWTVDAR